MELVPLKVRITLSATPGQPRMQYPTSFREHIEGRYAQIYYDQTAGLDHGEAEEWCMALVPAQIAETVLTQDPGNYQELDLAAANDFVANRALRDRLYKVDDGVVRALQLKQSLGQTLTPEENHALDPDKPTEGVRRIEKDITKILPHASITNTTRFPGSPNSA